MVKLKFFAERRLVVMGRVWVFGKKVKKNILTGPIKKALDQEATCLFAFWAHDAA